MKQGVKIYGYAELATQRKEQPRGQIKGVLELVQADMRKQNQLGWYVHQVIGQGVAAEARYMVVYRRDEEM